ncbi:MAG: Ig-like domain-containing protein, partial [Bacteroidota bacterium]
MRNIINPVLLLSSTFLLLLSTSLAQEKNPLKVIGTFPKGQTEGTNQTRTIIATFNRPMVPLQELPEGDGSGPLTITPSLKGKYRWLGTSTLSFTASETLEVATEYRVTIPSGLKASDGSTLAKAVSWTFTTPRPVLVASFPGHNQRWVGLNPAIFLRFSQRMNVARASSFIQMKEGSRDGVSVPITLGVPTNEEMQKAKLYWSSDTTTMFAMRLQRPLSKNKRYIVVLAKG